MATATSAAPAGPRLRFDRSLAGGWTLARRARLGSVRFGGEALTRRMLEGAQVGEGSRVVDLAPGYGATGALLNDVNLRSYTAVVPDTGRMAAVRGRVEGPAREVVLGAPDATGLPDQEATAVIGEGLLTGVSDPTKVAILAEACRIVRPGGLVAFHELIALRDAWSDDEVPLRRELGTVGLRPLDEAGWRRVMAQAGLDPIGLSLGAVEAPSPRQAVADAGRGAARGVIQALTCPGRAARGFHRAAYLLDAHRDGLAGVVLVGRRPVLARR